MMKSPGSKGFAFEKNMPTSSKFALTFGPRRNNRELLHFCRILCPLCLGNGEMRRMEKRNGKEGNKIPTTPPPPLSPTHFSVHFHKNLGKMENG
jgi:hypothetical protein